MNPVPWIQLAALDEEAVLTSQRTLCVSQDDTTEDAPRRISTVGLGSSLTGRGGGARGGHRGGMVSGGARGQRLPMVGRVPRQSWGDCSRSGEERW